MGETRIGKYIIGIDIGGANLKLSDADEKCIWCSFPLWLQADRLGERVKELLEHFARVDCLAVTMTGELADCFATRRQGVTEILNQLSAAFNPDRTWIYSIDQGWLTPQAAASVPWSVAASNWHALARWIAGIAHTQSVASLAGHVSLLLVDIGSTTVDIVPIRNAIPATAARTDRERMELGQLVYTGVERTPISAVARHLIVNGRRTPVMAERFATTSDAYLALSLVPENSRDCDTADSRPKTSAFARARLARMVGEDTETLSANEIDELARQVIELQASQISNAINRNLASYFGANDEIVAVCTGHGRPLVERALTKIAWHLPVVWLDELLDPAAARCATAMAVAALLQQEL